MRLESSAAFASSPRRLRLLRYLVEKTLAGAGRDLNEYAIGLDVFSKPASFDPRLESVVRNEVMRLRQKLSAHYAAEGIRDGVRFEVPKRSYSVSITFHDNAPEQIPAATPELSVPREVAPLKNRRRAGWPQGLAAALGGLALVAFLGIAFSRNATKIEAKPANGEAEDLYLKGRYFWEKRSASSLPRAVDYFTRAIVRDPGYVRAYVGLADCYNLLPEYSAMPGSEAFPRAMEAARRAVKLDDSSAEAHASLGFSSAYWAWDFQSADREFRRAIVLDPGYVPAHHWRATMLMSLGRGDEASNEIEQAQRLNPASNSILADKGLILYYAGRRDEAVTLLTQLKAAEPSFPSPRRYLSYIDFFEGRYPDSLRELREASLRMQDAGAARGLEETSKAFANGGLPSMFAAQVRLHRANLVSAFALAETAILLGKRKEAIAYLSESSERHEFELLTMWCNPVIGRLRAEPEFRALSKKLLRQPA